MWKSLHSITEIENASTDHSLTQQNLIIFLHYTVVPRFTRIFIWEQPHIQDLSASVKRVN